MHCFYRLRQLRPIRQSLDAESTATLVRAFVTSRVDYCNSVLAGAPMALTDKLQRVLNAASDTYPVSHAIREIGSALDSQLHNFGVTN